MSIEGYPGDREFAPGGHPPKCVPEAADPTDEDLLTYDRGHGQEVGHGPEHAQRVASAVADVLDVLLSAGPSLTDREKKTALKIVLRNI